MIGRVLLAALAVLMLLFAGAQYNDPDGLYWGTIYAVPALFALAASVRPATLGNPIARAALLSSLALAVVGTYVYWPQEPAFWRQTVWWESETAREGMGMMIVAVALAIIAASTLLRRA